jgi:hypothetical protein
MASTELRKHARQIGGHTTAATVHMRGAIHATILVLTKIVPFAPMRVRKHCVGFDNQFELFFIAALEPTEKKRKKVRDRNGQWEERGGGAPCLDDV